MNWVLHYWLELALGTTVVFAVLRFLLKRLVDAAVQLGVEKAKAVWRADLEAAKADWRSELERLKAALEVDIVKARLGAGRLDEVLPKLLYRIRRAEGAVAGLWGARWGTDLSKHDQDDFAELLKRLRVAGQERKETLAMLATDRARGIRQVERLQRRRELEDARRQTDLLRNILLVNTLFIPKPIRQATWAIHQKLSDAWVEVHVGEMNPRGNSVEKHRELTKSAATEIDALQDVMQAALEPAPWDSKKPE